MVQLVVKNTFLTFERVRTLSSCRSWPQLNKGSAIEERARVCTAAAEILIKDAETEEVAEESTPIVYESYADDDEDFELPQELSMASADSDRASLSRSWTETSESFSAMSACTPVPKQDRQGTDSCSAASPISSPMGSMPSIANFCVMAEQQQQQQQQQQWQQMQFQRQPSSPSQHHQMWNAEYMSGYVQNSTPMSYSGASLQAYAPCVTAAPVMAASPATPTYSRSSGQDATRQIVGQGPASSYTAARGQEARRSKYERGYERGYDRSAHGRDYDRYERYGGWGNSAEDFWARKTSAQRPSKTTRLKCKVMAAQAIEAAAANPSKEELQVMRDLASQSPYMKSLLRRAMEELRA